jgi:hypothetical protein
MFPAVRDWSEAMMTSLAGCGGPAPAGSVSEGEKG